MHLPSNFDQYASSILLRPTNASTSSFGTSISVDDGTHLQLMTEHILQSAHQAATPQQDKFLFTSNHLELVQDTI
jgi:hypothetical protein